MEIVVDFLLEYWVWFVVVIVILLITVVGFLVDTKKKKKLRDSVNNNNNNEHIDNGMNMNNMNMMGNINDINSMGMNNSFNVNASNNMNNINNVNDMNSVNNGFFNPSMEQTNNFEPRPVESTPIMNNNMNNNVQSIPTPVVEPTVASVNPIPEVNIPDNNINVGNVIPNFVDGIPNQNVHIIRSLLIILMLIIYQFKIKFLIYRVKYNQLCKMLVL